MITPPRFNMGDSLDILHSPPLRPFHFFFLLPCAHSLHFPNANLLSLILISLELSSQPPHAACAALLSTPRIPCAVNSILHSISWTIPKRMVQLTHVINEALSYLLFFPPPFNYNIFYYIFEPFYIIIIGI